MAVTVGGCDGAWEMGAIRRMAAIALVAAAPLTAAALPSGAGAATGDLTYKDCITGKTEVGPSGSGACSQIASAASNALDSGMQYLTGVALSPDGTSLYGASFGGAGVARFSRNATTGALSYQGCITGDTNAGPSGSGACSQIASADALGANSGLNLVTSVIVSPDGKSVYAAATGNSAVARFNRDTDTGALTYKGCISGDTQTGGAGSGACTTIPKATSGGDNSGLENDYDLAISPDGKSLYTASAIDDSVATFDRNTSTGALSYSGCITGETESGPSGPKACTQIPSAHSGGAHSGMDFAISLAVSPDGESVYVGSGSDSAVARFSRDTATGELSYQGCISGDTDAGPGGSGACAQIPDAQAGGTYSGLHDLESLALSPDGSSLYATAIQDDSIATFDRAGGGALSYQGCITGDTNAGPSGSAACSELPHASAGGDDSGLKYPGAVSTSPDGNSAYVETVQDATVTQFDRASGGGLSFHGCFTGDTQSGPGGSGACAEIASAMPDGVDSGLLHSVGPSPGSLAVSPDGASLYTADAIDASVASFDRELAPTPPPPPPPPTSPSPSNEFSIGSAKGKKVDVTVPGAGRIDVRDAKATKRKLLLGPSHATAPGAGTVPVPLKLTKPAKKKLKRKHKVKVRAAITFTPTGGTANTRAKALKVKKK